MDAILECVFQKWKQLQFSVENYLNYTKKTQFFFACDNYIFWNKGKQEQAMDPLLCP